MGARLPARRSAPLMGWHAPCWSSARLLSARGPASSAPALRPRPALLPCSEAAHGGQVIVSEKAWAAVQDQLPGQPHVVSLGSHLLDLSSAPAAPPLLLMEVMPQGG